MSREAVHRELSEGRRWMREMVEGRRFSFWLIGGFIVIVASWVIFSQLIVPSIIENAYRGESLPFLNDIISGQAIHPVEHYLASWETISWRLLGVLSLIGITALLFGLFLGQTTTVPSGIKIFLAADVSLGLAYLFIITILPPSWFMSEFFNLNAEANLPTWYSSMKLFLIAVLLSIFAYNKLENTVRGKSALVLAPIVFFILSLDETARIHEWLGHKMTSVLVSSETSSVFPNTGMWMFWLAPLLLGVILYIGRSAGEYLDERGHIARKYVWGMVIFVGSAAGIEILWNFVSGSGVTGIIQVTAEEVGEMIGATILLWATWDLLVSHHFSVRTAGDDYHNYRAERWL